MLYNVHFVVRQDRLFFFVVRGPAIIAFVVISSSTRKILKVCLTDDNYVAMTLVPSGSCSTMFETVFEQKISNQDVCAIYARMLNTPLEDAKMLNIIIRENDGSTQTSKIYYIFAAKFGDNVARFVKAAMFLTANQSSLLYG